VLSVEKCLSSTSGAQNPLDFSPGASLSSAASVEMTLASSAPVSSAASSLSAAIFSSAASAAKTLE
jgi:hypothetical protein